METLSTDYSENEDYCPSSYESNDKSGWTWRKGLNWGKKMAVMGVVITSAPLVLPLFVALSALGFAFSLPAGIAFVTYACTDKLVNGLLPMPIDDTEKEFEEDKGSEIGLKERNNEIDVNREKVDREAKVHEIVEESVYDQDAGEYMEEEERTLNSSVIPDIVEGIRQEEDEISSMKIELAVDSLQAVVVAVDLGGENDNLVELVSEEVSILAPSEGLSESDTSVDKGSIIPEEVKAGKEVTTGSKSEAKSSSSVGTKQKGNKKRSKGDKSGLAKEVNEKAYGGHTHTTISVHQETSSDRKAGTSTPPNVDEGGSDVSERRTTASKKKTDLPERRPKGTPK